MHHNRVPQARHPTLGMSLRSSSQSKWHHILTFFWMLYVSTAEVLPNKFVMPAEDLTGRSNVDPDYDERYVQSFLRNIDQQFQLPNIEQIGPGTFAGPRRYIEHCLPSDLFYQYCVTEEANGRQPASLSTFMRIYKFFCLSLEMSGEERACRMHRLRNIQNED